MEKYFTLRNELFNFFRKSGSYPITKDVHMLLKRKSELHESSTHGIKHWKDVERNGLLLASKNNADIMVVSCFAYLHDCMRVTNSVDMEHGPRAAEFIKSHKRYFNLNDKQFKILIKACRGHTFGMPSSKEINITIATCWDADRMDIGRIGVNVDDRYLFTDEAKEIIRNN